MELESSHSSRRQLSSDANIPTRTCLHPRRELFARAARLKKLHHKAKQRQHKREPDDDEASEYFDNPLGDDDLMASKRKAKARQKKITKPMDPQSHPALVARWASPRVVTASRRKAEAKQSRSKMLDPQSHLVLRAMTLQFTQTLSSKLGCERGSQWKIVGDF
jgi:hypothetical protein